MRKGTKSALLTALVLFLLGLLATIFAFVFAACSGTSLFGDNHREYNYESFDSPLDELTADASFQSNQLNEISIDVQAAEIEVVPTDAESHIEFYNCDRNNLSISYHAGILTLNETYPVNRLCFTVSGHEIRFSGLRHLFQKNATVQAQRIILHLNASDALPSLRISTTYGSIKVDQTLETALNLSTVVGPITLNDCTSESGSVVAHSTFGTIRSTNNRFESCTFQSTIGNIYTTVNCGKTVATTAVGNIHCDIVPPEGEFHLRATTTFGAINDEDGSSLGTQFNLPAQSGSTYIQLTSTLGMIRLS